MTLQYTDVRTITTPPYLDWDQGRELVFGLNKALATLTDLAVTYKQAHWNVLGPGFAQLHLLFDQFADETRTYIDTVAERAVSLGGVAHGTLENVAEHTALAPFPAEERDQVQLLRELSRRVERVLDELREAIEASGAGDVWRARALRRAAGNRLHALRARLPDRGADGDAGALRNPPVGTQYSRRGGLDRAVQSQPLELD